MKIRPYLVYAGNCEEALELYQRAFQTEVLELMRFGDMPAQEGYVLPESMREHVLQATLRIGEDFIRLSDGAEEIQEAESERIALSVECGVEQVKYAFNVLAEAGSIRMPLEETFYSPCAGMVVDKFGVMWNFAAQG